MIPPDVTQSSNPSGTGRSPPLSFGRKLPSGQEAAIPDERPKPPAQPPSHAPARRLSATEVEAVLRRAVQLQMSEGEEPGASQEGMPEEELTRIGREIGLSPRHIQQALVETSAAAEPADGLLGRTYGPAAVRVSRLLRIPAERAVDELDRYVREREWMVIHRRFSDRSVYTRAAGFAADLQRGLSGISNKYPRLDAAQVEIGVRKADERSCYVSMRADLRGTRSSWVGGGLFVGTSAGATMATVLGIAIAPPAALIGAPVLAAAVWGTRAGYQRTLQQKRGQIESILDRLEHGELLPDGRPALRERLGL